MEAMGEHRMAPRALASAAPTILDWLNEDCWRLVLDYIPVEDIVRSECVSHQWQGMVHHYFQDVSLCLHRYRYPFARRQRHGRMIVLEKHSSEALDSMTGLVALTGLLGPRREDGKESTWNKIVKKWGAYIVACECNKAENLKMIMRNCPNLEELTLNRINTDQIKQKTFQFKKLRRISFQFCDSLPDSFVSRFLENTTIEELVFDRNIQGMTGACLSNLKSHPKSIHFNCSFEFKFDHLLASDRTSNLTKLDLSENVVKVLEDLHLLLEKTPNLEYLYLDWYNDMKMGHEKLLQAISRLTRLKHISLMRNYNVRDSWLEVLGRCPQLRSVDVSVCEVTGRGLAALCRGAGARLAELGAGARLAELGVEGNDELTHEDLLACILACPNLKALNAGWVSASLQDLARVLAAARAQGRVPRGLRVRISDRNQWRRALSRAKGVAKRLDFVDFQAYPDASNCYLWMQEMRTSKRR